ncbi:hypothetical protein CRENBAI_011978 [Crenichthys baileyi]|uniref:CHCH domain-containing protein n=1 Tax=Crenichthys baileyi TaxID=28760 RepID=A0AAV9R7H8_9TELE
MGSGGSTTRKVSFAVDDEDRVRILRGIKLSEDVLQRMRGVANIPPEPSPSPSSSSGPSPQTGKGASCSASSASQAQQSSQHRAQPSSKSSKSASFSKDEQRRYERQQAILKDELAKMAEREREAAREEMAKAMSRERQVRQEAEKAKELSADEIEAMAQQLQKKDSQLKALGAFYKEQLAQLEQKNLERFKESKDQFHQAATVTEASVRSRNTAPVCPGLQAQILSCYKDNKEQTLKCSDLAKEYMQCINAAKKNMLVNHG